MANWLDLTIFTTVAFIGAECLIAVEAPIDCLFLSETLHASQAAIVFSTQGLFHDLSVDNVAIDAAWALEAHWDIAATCASDHLCLVGDLVVAVEALSVHLLGATRHIQIVTIVACLLNDIFVVGHSVCHLDPTCFLFGLKKLLFLGQSWFFLGFDLIIVDSASFICLKLLCMLFLKHPCLESLLFLLLLAHELEVAHELSRHLLDEGCNSQCLPLVLLLGANLDNLGDRWLSFLELCLCLNSMLEGVGELLV